MFELPIIINQTYSIFEAVAQKKPLLNRVFLFFFFHNFGYTYVSTSIKWSCMKFDTLDIYHKEKLIRSSYDAYYFRACPDFFKKDILLPKSH